MAKLSAQDKLALALTSAGSMRKLAAQLGMSHQKVGRWLRESEGPPHGVRAIPAAAAETIDRAFKDHVAVTRRQAKSQGLPTKGIPVYAERRPLETGELGDRVFVEHTQFLRRELLDQVVQQSHQSKQFAHVSVRSVVDIHTYAKAQAKLEVQRRRRGGLSERTIAKHIADAIEGKEKRLMGEVHLRPLFTAYTPIYPGSDLRAAVHEVDAKLREKHEPATGAKGTKLADQLLFQLLPKQTRRGKRK